MNMKYEIPEIGVLVILQAVNVSKHVRKEREKYT